MDVSSPQTLTRVSEVVNGRGRELVVSAIAAARDLLGMEMAFVSQLTPDEQIYRFVGGDTESFGMSEGHVGASDHGYCVRMVDGLIPNVIPDVRGDSRTAGVVATVAADVGAYVGVPLRLSDGRLYGSFCCLSHRARPELGAHEHEIMALLARLIGDELEREIVARDRLRLEIEANASQALLAALHARENYTADHSRSVLELSLAVGRQLGLEPRELTEVGQVAVLHDIGKVGVPDHVLRKDGPLDDAEEELMRSHPEIGARIVASVEGLAHLAPAVRAEHERWDGQGYPDGLAGEEIPLASRICFVCDAYDAMTNDRPYRSSLRYRDAVAELTREAGRQFDPHLVDVLLDVLRGHPLSGPAAADLGPLRPDG
jgi:HD-GYP domain-containing protein (c-di-GMP phosphodiesterase class II)